MSFVNYERKNGISYILFNRPDRYNALHKEMIEELLKVVEKVEVNDDRMVILSGQGKAFSAGGDMQMLKDFGNRQLYEEIMDMLETIILKLYLMPKIVISAVNGSVAGLGLSIALVGDYVVSKQHAKFGVLFLGVGLVPDGGGHFFLRERLGTHQAKQFTWNMKQVEGIEAKEMGLVDVVAYDESVIDRATKFGQYILTKTPIQAMIKTKKIYHSYNEDDLRHFLAQEREAQWAMSQTIDHKEGVQAFIEKRQPQFKGK